MRRFVWAFRLRTYGVRNVNPAYGGVLLGKKACSTGNAGMPNLRKNPFSRDFYRLFQSTGEKKIYGRIYGFFLTRFIYYPPPIALSRSRYSTGKTDFSDESTDLFVLSSATFARAE